MPFQQNEKHFLIERLRIRILIYMWLTAERDNLMRLYSWSKPCTWSPWQIQDLCEILRYIRLSMSQVVKICKKQVCSNFVAFFTLGKNKNYCIPIYICLYLKHLSLVSKNMHLIIILSPLTVPPILFLPIITAIILGS